MTHQTDERGDPISSTHDPDRTVYAARETRQGFLGRRVFMVLAASLVLVMIVWGAVELWGNRLGPDEPAADAPQSSTTTDTTTGTGTAP